MKGSHWLASVVVALAFLGGCFFFFLGSFFHVLWQVSGKPQKGNVAVLEIVGGIFDPKPVTEEIVTLKKSDEVKAVVLRIDSPGGSVSASQEIFEAVKDLGEVKPVVASMGTVAASGGYYVAAAAKKIFANEGTITGSIGVRMDYINIENLLQWAQIHYETLKSGALKDVGSPTRPMTPEERTYLEDLLKKMHEQFKRAVSTSRNIPLEEVEKIADGRVFTGLEAKDLKLVDEIGSLLAATKEAARMGGIQGEPDVFYPSEEVDFWRSLVEGISSKIVEKAYLILAAPAHFTFSY